ncbi:MAG: hypothetical protein ABMA64_12980 [Myxococcota bacterium]
MLTMRCDRCKQERPLERFTLHNQRYDYLSNELAALDRLRRNPVVTCDVCATGPSSAEQGLDYLLADRAVGRPTTRAGWVVWALSWVFGW